MEVPSPNKNDSVLKLSTMKRGRSFVSRTLTATAAVAAGATALRTGNHNLMFLATTTTALAIPAVEAFFWSDTASTNHRRRRMGGGSDVLAAEYRRLRQLDSTPSPTPSPTMFLITTTDDAILDDPTQDPTHNSLLNQPDTTEDESTAAPSSSQAGQGSDASNRGALAVTVLCLGLVFAVTMAGIVACYSSRRARVEQWRRRGSTTTIKQQHKLDDKTESEQDDYVDLVGEECGGDARDSGPHGPV